MASAQQTASVSPGPPIADAPTRVAATHTSLRYEVATAAIAAALANEGLNLPAATLHLPVPLSATVEAPALRVVSAELRHDDALLLHLACRAAAECMPFFASAAMPDHTAATTAMAELHSSSAPASAGPARTGTPGVRSPGVAIGAHITVELADRQMRIQLPGIAIDTGQPGAEVRVASLDRKHTYRGIVVDATTVRGDLE